MSHIHTPGNRLVILNSQWHLEKLWNILHEESRLTFTYPPPPTPITILWTQGGKNTSVTFDLQVSLFSFGPSLCFYIHFSFCLCLFITFPPTVSRPVPHEEEHGCHFLSEYKVLLPSNMGMSIPGKSAFWTVWITWPICEPIAIARGFDQNWVMFPSFGMEEKKG